MISSSKSSNLGFVRGNRSSQYVPNLELDGFLGLDFVVVRAVVVRKIVFVFSCVSSMFRNSLKSSSHLLLGLPTCRLVLMLVSSPGCQSKTLLFHLFSFGKTILRAIRHFVLLCISSQHCILCFSICSLASLVLLFMNSIQSSSISVAVNFFFDFVLERNFTVLVFV